MSVQDAVLDILERNPGTFFSGEMLAKELDVSRNAVWKAVRKLSEAGYAIEGISGRGYALQEGSDVLTPASVVRRLETDFPVRIEVRREVTSTNTVLKQEAERGAPEGSVLIAESQTAGKGRLGRQFHSPLDTGLYLSILLRPSFSAEQSLFITTAAAVAVAEAVEDITGHKTQIKWVNDIYLEGRKVCGILTEANVDFESGRLNWAVLGIGINIAKPPEGFPEEIKDIATALFPDGCSVAVRSSLAAAVISRFFTHYERLTEKEFMSEYKRRSFLTGKEVTFTLGNETIHGVVTGISDDAHLLVKTENGEERAFSAGEVTLHKEA